MEGIEPTVNSPNDVMVEADELVDGDQNEKDSLTIISPDQLGTDSDHENDLPLATDFEAMKELVLPPLMDEPRILEDQASTWTIEAWRQMSKKEHGPIFQAGGAPWRVLLFPFGNNIDQCSIYLEHGFENPDDIPDDWSCCVQFALVLWNPNDPSLYSHHHAHHRFTKEEGDWGFTRFTELRKMFNVSWNGSGRPLVEEDSANITAYVRIVEDETGVLWHNFNNYDSKKETGYVGLKNQGATCYLNSLLQSLYFTNAFRKAIYQIPTQEDESLLNSAYTLQRLFYQLQNSSSAVGTNELTRSFGWETRHIFEQQDVQELSRKLMERMEEKMKGTEAENVLPKLFCGKVKTYISCINVPYESSRIEDFWDIQLNVSGNNNIEDSFRDYIQVEKMEGENQYFAGDQYKLQDANKGVIFTSFPDVLHLQLKRFQYDIQRDSMMKINDRYEFPDTFDAAPFLTEDANKSEPWLYQLHGVLVHSGDLNAGHYYAFIKPGKDGWFYRYDDDKVTKATMREVLEENYGGEYKPPHSRYFQAQMQRSAPIMRQNSAYMLVYIRQSRLDYILQPVTQEDTPIHIQRKLEEEAEMRRLKQKERDEAHLYVPVRVITDSTFQNHSGTDLTSFDNNFDDPGTARFYKMLREATVQELVELIAKDTDQDPKRLRLWIMVNRQNKTIRPDQPIMDPRMNLQDIAQRMSNREQSIRLWAEVADETGPDGEAIWPSYVGQTNGIIVKNDLLLLFLKWFDVEHQRLRGVSHIYMSKEKKVEDLVPVIMKKMVEKMGWPEKLPSGEKLSLWEEIKPTMIEGLAARKSLKASELQDGDIICFQRTGERNRTPDRILDKPLNLLEKPSIPKPIISSDRIDDARDFYDFLVYRRTIHFHPHPSRCDKATYPPFDLTLTARLEYDQLAAKVGDKIGVDGTHLRFFTVNAANGNPKGPVRRAHVQNLGEILNPRNYALNTNTRSDALYFEVLEMSLAELDTKKSIRITWLSEGITKEENYDILVSKSGIVDDVIEALIKKAKIPDEQEGGPIRVYEMQNHKIWKDLTRSYSVLSITDYTTVVAERVPEEEINADVETCSSINAFHFQSDPTRVHGVPFKFMVKEGEKFSETKKRLEARTGLKGKSFEKIKFAVVRRTNYPKPTYLQDDDILWDLAVSQEESLGLDHVDRTRTIGNGAAALFLK